jgi:hypothetical protein
MQLDDILNLLQETPKRMSRSTISRQTKIDKATGLLSSIEARKKNDPLYKKMLRHRELYFQYKTMIHRKYGSRVRSKARR